MDAAAPPAPPAALELSPFSGEVIVEAAEHPESKAFREAKLGRMLTGTSGKAGASQLSIEEVPVDVDVDVDVDARAETDAADAPLPPQPEPIAEERDESVPLPRPAAETLKTLVSAVASQPPVPARATAAATDVDAMD